MIEVTSAAFPADGPIPSKYTCDGDGVSPPLAWAGIPDNATSLAILVDDPDSGERPFLHWLVADLPPELHNLDEGATVPHEAQVAESDAGNMSYYGPCPVTGRHHYHFHVYALDTTLGHQPESRDEFLSAIEGHVLDEGELIGTYQRVRA